MIWKKCTLWAKHKTGTDELDNDIYGDVKVLDTKARYTPWTNEQIALEGREVTKNSQLYALQIKTFPRCDYAEIDGIKREIKEVINLYPRYTVIRVSRYKESV